MWGFLLKIGIALALIAAVYVQTIRLRASEARYAALGASVSAKTAKAELDDRKHAETVTAAQDTVSKETADDLSRQLASARTDAANYSRRLRSTAVESRGRTPDMSAPANAAGSPDGADQTAIVDADAIACAEGVTKAQGWQDWWTEVSAIPR